jgi:DNA-binding NarL/FixJ family response regulator
MKTQLVIEHEVTIDMITRHLAALGFDFIHYTNPVKAMDNIEEIQPDLVIFSAEDFPRHWKPFVRLLRAVRNKEEAVFILLRGASFPTEEASKATALGVNGIVNTSLATEEFVRNLEDIFSRYNIIDDARIDRRIPGRYAEEIDFAFTHPDDDALVTGTITDISLGGLSLDPDTPHITAVLPEGTVLEECSLSIDDEVYTVRTKLIRNNRLMAFSFLELSDELRAALVEYLDRLKSAMRGVPV